MHQFTFACARRTMALFALVLPPLVAYAPNHCRLLACVIAWALLGLAALLYRLAFQAEIRAAKEAAKDEGAASFLQFVKGRRATHPGADATRQVGSETPQASSPQQ